MIQEQIAEMYVEEQAAACWSIGPPPTETWDSETPLKSHAQNIMPLR
jgi:hypothetical protein